MTEAALHTTVAEYLNLALPADAVWHHSPNEGKRGFKAQRDIKKMGVHKGWPDIEIVYRGEVVFIELKAGTRKLSPDQLACHVRLEAAGCPVALCRSLDDVETFLWELMPMRATAKAKPA